MPKPMVQWLVFTALALAWGSSFMFIKIGVTYVGPFTLVAGRLFIALVAIALFSWKERAALPESNKRWLQIFFLGVINLALPITLISWGEQTIDSSLAAVLNSTVPVWTVALAHPLLIDERLTRKKLLGIVLGFAGVVILVGLPTGSGNTGSPFAGSLAVAAASLSYALASIYVRCFLRDVPHTQLVLVSLISALLIMTVLMLTIEGLPNRLHPRALLAMAWLGLVGTAFALPALLPAHRLVGCGAGHNGDLYLSRGGGVAGDRFPGGGVDRATGGGRRADPGGGRSGEPGVGNRHS